VKPAHLLRLLAVLVALSYVVAATVSGGFGGLVVALLLTVGPLLFIWWGAELGNALGWDGGPKGLRSGRLAALAIQGGGWVLLLAEVAGFILNRR
jgi:hypothetical protein